MGEDTQSISLSEGPVHHTASEGQHRLLLSVATEGSPESGPRDEWGRPPAWTPPRPLPRVLSWAYLQLSTPGSGLQHCVYLPLCQLEDLEPPKAEPEGEKARGGDMGVWGGVSAGLHGEETPEAGVGPGAKAGLRLPIWWTAVREVPGLGLLWKALGRFLYLEKHMARQEACR